MGATRPVHATTAVGYLFLVPVQHVAAAAAAAAAAQGSTYRWMSAALCRLSAVQQNSHTVSHLPSG
jgi:hypothetical protein